MKLTKKQLIVITKKNLKEFYKAKHARNTEAAEEALNNQKILFKTYNLNNLFTTAEFNELKAYKQSIIDALKGDK